MTRLLALSLLAVTFVSGSSALDREAFTVTHYQLEVQIDRPSHVMAVTGRLTLRNDSKVPQKNLALQVSSSLKWNGIAIDNAPVEWIGDDYTSDIDHTGKLSEAIVTLQASVLPSGTIALDVQFGGAITPNSTRLTRMGAPADLALRNDWDQISPIFTALRGLGYVVWYPVAIPAVSMSDGNSVVEAIAAWKSRHQKTQFEARIVVVDQDAQLCIVGNAMTSSCGTLGKTDDPRTGDITNQITNDVLLTSLAKNVPAFAVADYTSLEQPGILLSHVRSHADLAQDFAAAAAANQPVLNEWLGPSSANARVIELTDPNANPYQVGPVLFTPLRKSSTLTLQQLLIPVQVAARINSPDSWMEEGLQRFLQATNIEHSSGRKAALQFLDEYRLPLIKAEESPQESSSTSGSGSPRNSLMATSDEILLRGKGSYIFWMLRDMVADAALQKALLDYGAGADRTAEHFQKLLEQNSRRDLGWFFDDWVYQDRGLPELRVENVYTPAHPEESTKLRLVTVTIDNSGGASAEVPVTIQTATGEKSIRILAKAHQKTSERVQLPEAPTKVTVNDGSVPESDPGNNIFDVPASSQP